MATRIARAAVYRLRLPLEVPYHLAFGVVDAYDTLVAELVDDEGRSGFGEATILAGYSDETIEESWEAAKAFAREVPGALPATALANALTMGSNTPFAATAFGTALEMLLGTGLLQLSRDVSVPLVGLLAAKDEETLRIEFAGQWEAGFRTMKVKVGFDVQKDSRRVRLVQQIVGDKALIRLDANQGYTASQGIEFVSALDPSSIELFEQPCAAGDWEAHLAVARHANVPMMLDESIHGLADIEQAASLHAAQYIKLKLMKLVTMERLQEAILRIKALGMTPVLGNGVAADIGCWMEACIAARHIDTAGEMNGFLKTRASFLTTAMRFDHGALHLEAGFAPSIDLASIDRYAVDSVAHGTMAANPQ